MMLIVDAAERSGFAEYRRVVLFVEVVWLRISIAIYKIS
jgi:hypothetical protein